MTKLLKLCPHLHELFPQCPQKQLIQNKLCWPDNVLNQLDGIKVVGGRRNSSSYQNIRSNSCLSHEMCHFQSVQCIYSFLVLRKTQPKASHLRLKLHLGLQYLWKYRIFPWLSWMLLLSWSMFSIVSGCMDLFFFSLACVCLYILLLWKAASSQSSDLTVAVRSYLMFILSRHDCDKLSTYAYVLHTTSLFQNW